MGLHRVETYSAMLTLAYRTIPSEFLRWNLETIRLSWHATVLPQRAGIRYETGVGRELCRGVTDRALSRCPVPRMLFGQFLSSDEAAVKEGQGQIGCKCPGLAWKNPPSPSIGPGELFP